MSDFQTLDDAFTELARRADAAVPAALDTTAAPAISPHRHQLLLVAASVVATLAAAGVTALVTRGGGHPAGQAGGEQAATAGPSAAPPAGFQLPQTSDDLIARFRRVLDELSPGATFTVTDTGAAVTVTLPPAPVASVTVTENVGGQVTTAVPAIHGGPPVPVPLPASPGEPNGAAIVGTLTADGVTGGYDIQIFQDRPGARAWCDGPQHCTVTRTADGGSLAVQSTELSARPTASPIW